ncbi:MAG: Rrf2 family transcriptional regulator [Candidatus Omnitrophica bacterium]|nr:Rrf2 family transcriptional regulator [Candidatus Omnitrophota bacterium]
MKLISRSTDYAIRAVCYIFKNKKKIISASELVEDLKIPRSFLRKILQKLNKNKILKSYKGAGGGFLVSKPANRIFLTDLIEVFQGPLKLNECFFKKLKCPNTKSCLLRGKIKKIERYIVKELSLITVESLLR